METVTVRIDIACATFADAQALRSGHRRTLAEALYRAADTAATTEFPVDLNSLAGGVGGEARGSGRGWLAHALNLMTFLSGMAFGSLLVVLGLALS